MAAKECCCCSIFPCFTDKKNTVSAQPASSAIGLSPLNVNSPASVGETHTGDSSHAISYSETASPPPRNDLDNIQSHGSHPNSPLAASSSPSIAHERGNQVGSSEPAGANDIGNASPVAAPALQSSHETSFSGTAASTANASDNIVSHDSQAISSSGASSSQPYVPSSSTPSSHDSQAICSSGASSSQPYVPSSSTPSPSAPKESDYTTKIKDAARSVDTGNVNADLNELSNYISQYLAFIKGKREKPSQATAAKRDWPGSKCVFKLKEVVGQGVEAVKDFGEKNAKDIAKEYLKSVGSMHFLLTGFLVIANIMERFEKISKNKKVCLSLLEGMNTLVQHVKKLQERPGLKEGMKTQIEKAIKLIIKVSLAYCTQIDEPKYIRFFSTTAIEEELVVFQTKLTKLHNEIDMQMGLQLNDGIEKINIRQQKEPSYPQYPLHAFGIKRQVEKVIELLEWESHERGIAVILHGLGGMGKSTLADAVFATLREKKMEGCKYSFVRLFDNIASVQNIPKLQTYILRDLKMGEALAIEEIRRHNEGQNEIALMLQEKEAFIYIDTVLLPDTVEQGRDAIEQLLPTNTTGNLKKLRLLITTRDKEAAGGVCKQRGIKTNFYPIETLPDSEAMKLVKKTLVGGEENIDCNQINRIVDICGGIPRLLIKVAEFINSKDKRQAQKRYEMVIEEGTKKWNGEIGKEIARYVFAYEYCDQNLRDDLLDICSYFQGWCHWEELSNIVGDLDKLENRSLVTKDVKSMTARVHNVILAIGLDKKGERLTFSSASEFQEFLVTTENEKLRCIKGIWLDENSGQSSSGQISIPAQKLDLMGRSLRVLQLGNPTEVESQCNEIYEELYFFSARISHLPFVLSNLRKLRYLRYGLEDLQNLCQQPEDFGSLASLQELNLRGCRSLKSLPENIGNLKWLDSIDLSSTDLKELPDGFCNLSFLTKLTMDNCQHLEELPERFGDVKYLRKLRLVGCSSLKELPDSFSKLNGLEDLNLSGCVALKKLCTEFKSLSSLKVLSLKECKELEELPEGFHLLALLERLDLCDCDKLEGQPMEDIVKMNTLQIVEIQRSPLLQAGWRQIGESCIQWSPKVRS